MTSRTDIREFLISRRAKITPEQAGLPAYGNRRRAGAPAAGVGPAEEGREPAGHCEAGDYPIPSGTSSVSRYAAEASTAAIPTVHGPGRGRPRAGGETTAMSVERPSCPVGIDRRCARCRGSAPEVTRRMEKIGAENRVQIALTVYDAGHTR